MNGRNNYTILFICTVIFLLVLPDFVFTFFNESFKVSHDIKVLLLIIPLSVGLVTSRYRLISFVCLSILCLVQIIQFANIAYFGNLLSPYSLCLLSSELDDVIQEAGNVFFQYIYILPIVIVPFLIIAYLIRKNTKKSLWGTILLCMSFCFFGYKYYGTDRPRFNPNGIRFTIDNSLKAFWGYLMIKYKNYPIKNYLPYEVKDLNNTFDELITVVYIIGEGVNFKHMSLFGYERDTTPNLKKLSKENNFYYTQGIAGAISTVASCKFIMNVLREPDNVIQASKDTTNLFRLAKSRGFKTFYLSGQTEHLLSSISGVNYIDVVQTKDSNIIKVNELMDDYLLELLDKQKFGKRNFVVLHQRCIHTPYAKTPEANSKFRGAKNSMIDDYDNAMVYNDQIISKLFNRFNKQQKGRFYIIWTSDHNELMGENGLFGHGHGYLLSQTADIPIMIQSNDKTFMNSIKKTYKPNHYEIAKSVAKLLGYEVLNPNEEENIFYISGVDFNGKCGYIKYKKDLLLLNPNF